MIMLKHVKWMMLGVVLSGAGYVAPSSAFEQDTPIVTDSRIRTLVYNENEVYRLVTHYGFQSNIEFGPFEEIQTISIGDQVGWQIVPAGRYLFVKPLMDGAHTNMTVITTKRSYQFDLRSQKKSGNSDRDLAYVIRFFFPEEVRNAAPSSPEVAYSNIEYNALDGNIASGKNFNYTLSGDQSIAPVKVFDDGENTYFQFASSAVSPMFSRVGLDGSEQFVSAGRSGEYYVVNDVVRQFAVRSGSLLVCVYNESQQ